jgi:hypothetical protein
VSPTSEGQPGEKNVPPVIGLPCHAATQCNPESLGLSAREGVIAMAASATTDAAVTRIRNDLRLYADEFAQESLNSFIWILLAAAGGNKLRGAAEPLFFLTGMSFLTSKNGYDCTPISANSNV